MENRLIINMWLSTIICAMCSIISSSFLILLSLNLLFIFIYSYEINRRVYCVRAAASKSLIKKFIEDISDLNFTPLIIKDTRLKFSIICGFILSALISILYGSNILLIIIKLVLIMGLFLIMTQKKKVA